MGGELEWLLGYGLPSFLRLSLEVLLLCRPGSGLGGGLLGRWLSSWMAKEETNYTFVIGCTFLVGAASEGFGSLVGSWLLSSSHCVKVRLEQYSLGRSKMGAMISCLAGLLGDYPNEDYSYIIRWVILEGLVYIDKVVKAYVRWWGLLSVSRCGNGSLIGS